MRWEIGRDLLKYDVAMSVIKEIDDHTYIEGELELDVGNSRLILKDKWGRQLLRCYLPDRYTAGESIIVQGVKFLVDMEIN